MDAERRSRAGSHHHQRQADAEAQDQGQAQRELAQLHAQDQHRDCGRARDQSAGEPEGNDLPGGHVTVGKPAADRVGVLALMGILETQCIDVESVLMCCRGTYFRGVTIMMPMVVIVPMMMSMIVIVAVSGKVVTRQCRFPGVAHASCAPASTGRRR